MISYKDLFAPSKWSENGMKQIINSGFKTFDKQTNCITTGNALCSTQHSGYIRPYCEVECDGFSFKEGELMEYDLKVICWCSDTNFENLKRRTKKRKLYFI